MTDHEKPGVGLPFAGGIIVDTTGPTAKWGIVEMPDGRRVAHDVSRVTAGAHRHAAAVPTPEHGADSHPAERTDPSP
jgi:hypothetical protein